jgi:kynurenine formamidase
MARVEHAGTLVNVFYHNNPDGLPVDETSLEMVMGKAVVLDLRHIPDLGDTLRSISGRRQPRVTRRNAAASRLVMGPGLPSPMTWPSIRTTGVISSLVPVT